MDNGPEERPGKRPSKRERHRRIIAELQSNPTVRISTLAEEFQVSTETVRRDIDELSGRGLVSRTYGGAAATSMSREPALHERDDAMIAERERIARLAASLIEPDAVLMVDSGSTTAHFARRLAVLGTATTVITNGLGVATALGHCEAARVILCPGTYVGREHGVYGGEVTDFLGRYHANHAVIGAGGITAEGATDVDTQAAWVKRRMIERAERRMLLIDRGKFDVRLLEVICGLKQLDELVTDAAPPAAIRRALKGAGVTLHVA